MERNRRVFDDVKGEGSSLGFLLAVVSWRFEMIFFGKLLYFRSLGITYVVVLVSFWLFGCGAVCCVVFVYDLLSVDFLSAVVALPCLVLFFFCFSVEVAYLIKYENRLNGLV